jgi:biotin-dependent carboxylase-like uncharacterized protein
MFDFLEVISPGCGATFQDVGRPGWKRFGVPPGGWMDAAAAGAANGLLGNAEGAVVVELALQGARFRVLRGGWLAVAGAAMGWPPATARQVAAGEELNFTRHAGGVYAYLAAPGGWVAPAFLGSAAVSARSGLGRGLAAGEVLRSRGNPARTGGAGVADAEIYPWKIELEVWRGPQWDDFAPGARRIFFEVEWTVSARSDRMGVRLDGPVLDGPPAVMLSEPVRPGSVQVTGAGQPVVTMRDGPPVGGYPKMGWLEAEACRRLAQVPPGGWVKFRKVNE